MKLHLNEACDAEVQAIVRHTMYLPRQYMVRVHSYNFGRTLGVHGIHFAIRLESKSVEQTWRGAFLCNISSLGNNRQKTPKCSIL